MKAERLLNILMLLQAKGRVSSSELAESLEVSSRTIHRDMEALAAWGVPVYAERGREGGWLLSEGYRTNLTGMKREELQALLLVYATGTLKDLGLGEHFESALLKLMASLPPAYSRAVESVRHKVHVESSGWPRELRTHPLLPVLWRAVERCETMVIDYDGRGGPEPRRVEPLGLVNRGQFWYLVTREKKGYRIFRTDHLRAAKLTGVRFEPPPSFQLRVFWEEWWENFKRTIPRYPAEIEIESALLPRLRELPYLHMIRTRPLAEERSRARIDFETEERAVRMILWMGTEARVIAPARLKKRLRKESAELARIHM